MSARAELEKLLAEVALPGTWKIDLWEPGACKRFTGMAEWMREGEPLVERVVLQGCRTREQALDEVLAAVRTRLRRAS